MLFVGNLTRSQTIPIKRIKHKRLVAHDGQHEGTRRSKDRCVGATNGGVARRETERTREANKNEVGSRQRKQSLARGSSNTNDTISQCDIHWIGRPSVKIEVVTTRQADKRKSVELLK